MYFDVTDTVPVWKKWKLWAMLDLNLPHKFHPPHGWCLLGRFVKIREKHGGLYTQCMGIWTCSLCFINPILTGNIYTAKCHSPSMACLSTMWLCNLSFEKVVLSVSCGEYIHRIWTFYNRFFCLSVDLKSQDYDDISAGAQQRRLTMSWWSAMPDIWQESIMWTYRGIHHKFQDPAFSRIFESK